MSNDIEIEITDNEPIVLNLLSEAATNSITALTGDVTATGPGSAVATIPNDTVTFAKMQNIDTARLLGRSTASSGDIEQITIGSGLSLSGGELSASGGGGDVFGPASATDNAIAVFDGTTGKLLKNSNVLVGVNRIILDAASNSYLVYNTLNSRIEIYVGGVIKAAWG